MNWLMYIGGGIIFWIILMVIIRTCTRLEKIENTKSFPLIAITLFTSPLLVWIWICWRFISIK